MRPLGYVPSRRVVRVAWGVAAAVLLALFVWMIYLTTSTSAHLQRSDERLDQAQVGQQRATREAQQANTAALALARQVRRLGGKPVVQPSALPKLGPQGKQGVPGSTGAQGVPGIQGIQGIPGIRGLQGPAGPPGAPGKNGLAGAPGKDGANGLTGPTGPPGPAGPAGPQGDSGKDGTTGAQGDPGPAGRGITAITCDGPPVTFHITYSDGTTDTITCSTSAP